MDPTRAWEGWVQGSYPEWTLSFGVIVDKKRRKKRRREAVQAGGCSLRGSLVLSGSRRGVCAPRALCSW